MTEIINELISNEGVCRTAPATPGLLITWITTTYHMGVDKEIQILHVHRMLCSVHLGALHRVFECSVGGRWWIRIISSLLPHRWRSVWIHSQLFHCMFFLPIIMDICCLIIEYYYKLTMYLISQLLAVNLTKLYYITFFSCFTKCKVDWGQSTCFRTPETLLVRRSLFFDP